MSKIMNNAEDSIAQVLNEVRVASALSMSKWIKEILSIHEIAIVDREAVAQEAPNCPVYFPLPMEACCPLLKAGWVKEIKD